MIPQNIYCGYKHTNRMKAQKSTLFTPPLPKEYTKPQSQTLFDSTKGWSLKFNMSSHNEILWQIPTNSIESSCKFVMFSKLIYYVIKIHPNLMLIRKRDIVCTAKPQIHVLSWSWAKHIQHKYAYKQKAWNVLDHVYLRLNTGVWCKKIWVFYAEKVDTLLS